MEGIDIITNQMLQPNVRYVRLQVTDVSITLNEIYQSIEKTAWVETLSVNGCLKAAFKHRAEETAKKLKERFTEDISTINEKTGEYIVSESARLFMVENLNYANIPLAELLKEQVTGNPGFDFYSENLSQMILFGEAKYRGNNTGCYDSLNQIHEFIGIKKDLDDTPDIQNFVSKEAYNNFMREQKGYVAAFTTWGEPDAAVIGRITGHSKFVELAQYPELICVAIQMRP